MCKQEGEQIWIGDTQSNSKNKQTIICLFRRRRRCLLICPSDLILDNEEKPQTKQTNPEDGSLFLH